MHASLRVLLEGSRGACPQQMGRKGQDRAGEGDQGKRCNEGEATASRLRRDEKVLGGKGGSDCNYGWDGMGWDRKELRSDRMALVFY